MSFKIHRDAEANFNSKAEQLIERLSIRSEIPRHDEFPSELYVDHEINAFEVIGEMKQSEVDFTGKECARYFSIDGHLFGLQGEAYKDFDKLSEGIQRIQVLHRIVSIDSVKNQTFEWLTSRHKRETTLTLLEFIFPRLEAQVKEIEIWVPIYALIIQSEFTMGKVLFQPISKSRIEAWRSAAIASRSEEEAKNLAEYLEDERKEIQGLAAGTIKLTAEPERAGQIALETVEQSLNVLRFFEPANFHPKVISHCAILGKQNMETTKYYVIENSILVGSTANAVDSSYHPWKIDNDLLARMSQDGLDKLNATLASDNKSEFQNAIVDALQIYARSGAASFFSDKLLYIVSSLESVLLKNDSEPIQQNVGERMAFALSKNPEVRKRIVKNFRNVYDLRSDFVHHANDIPSEHVDTLQEFMLNAWHFLRLVIRNVDNFRTKQQMIDSIENIKFS